MTVLQRRKKPTHKQIAIIRRFCSNLCVISLPIEIFRRLNALFTTLCVQNVVFDCSAVSKQAHTQENSNHSSILSKFMRYFSPIEIFRRLNDLFTALCVQIVVHAISGVETSPDTSKSQSFVDFVQIYALFLSNRDISSFKRSFHYIVRADRSARVFHCRNKPRHTKIAIIHRF